MGAIHTCPLSFKTVFGCEIFLVDEKMNASQKMLPVFHPTPKFKSPKSLFSELFATGPVQFS